jgi:GT2 family glycosyltransferase
MPTPHVAVLIVSYRGREDTLECLRSLQAVTYSDWSVWLVDQASGDGTVEAVRENFPAVTVIDSAVNDGFAGGNNRGARAALNAGCDYLFLLNNDTVVAPDILDLLVAHCEENPRIGVAGPLMFYFDQPDIVWSAGGEIGPRGESRMIGQGVVRDKFDTPPPPYAVDFIVGCGLLTRRAVWERVGALDDRYFLYYEEADFCAAARRAGWGIETVPEARLWHKISRSTGIESDLTLYYMRRNALLYLERNAPHARAAAIADTLRLAAVWMVRGERRRPVVIVQAVIDYLLGRRGKSNRV